MSNESVDDITLRNVLSASEAGGELSRFVVPYERFASSAGASRSGGRQPRGRRRDDDENDGGAVVVVGGEEDDVDVVVPCSPPPAWHARTSVIDPDFLRVRHGLYHGCKLLPSSEGYDDDDGFRRRRRDPKISATVAVVVVDGTSVSYPPIPCIDTTIDARTLSRHSGTKAYLSGLSPNERTRLLFGTAEKTDDDANDDDDDDDDAFAPRKSSLASRLRATAADVLL